MNQIGQNILSRCRQVLSPEWQLNFAITEGDIRFNSVLTIMQLVERYGDEFVKMPFMEAIKELSDFFNADVSVSQAEQLYFVLKKEKVLTISDFSRFLGLLKIGKIPKPQFGKIDIPYLLEKINNYRLAVAENNHKFDEQYKKQKDEQKNKKFGISYKEWVETRTEKTPVVCGFLASKL